MFAPAAFAETDPDQIAAVIGRARLGLLVTHGPGGLIATHLPFVFDRQRNVLVGHVARANPQQAASGDGEALAVFTGADGYVSPDFYPSKAEHGRQVPTWNYEAAHVHGRLSWFDDRARLLDLLERLTDLHEAGRPTPWRVSDAPADYLERLLSGIVGVELAITRVEAQRKLSQNKPLNDRLGVIAGLAASEDPRDRMTAELMQEREA
ncbi:FMN-binding negative transcriptional regulator [Caulobacter sp. 17J65-9]|uniref:FMN-binding negative transcriptional regulator n=1 Tax=Caulobacter sp. 17J65-9 TaxID=2709382 RepID=UPI0013C767DD|nr:FMN-binding negative transcriptional regulator [Caulobacter sp. 17J65-9]NEX93404.1 FMN-binding negative transcriptional regulator [Caulobacter sp. 17J65-9]